MLTEQRYQIILDLLKEKKSVTATELKEILDTSESTVRRDITALHKAGKLIKVFGGAVALEEGETVSAYEPTVEQKSELHVEEKRKIAQYAVGLIEDEDFIYLDAGTTTGYMIDALGHTNAVFVTNAVPPICLNTTAPPLQPVDILRQSPLLLPDSLKMHLHFLMQLPCGMRVCIHVSPSSLP